LPVTFNPAKLVCITVYRPSSQSISELFFEEFTNLFEIISLNGSEIILSSDFNIYIDDLNNANVTRFLELFDVFGFQQ
jgi:hypothetical protein